MTTLRCGGFVWVLQPLGTPECSLKRHSGAPRGGRGSSVSLVSHRSSAHSLFLSLLQLCFLPRGVLTCTPVSISLDNMNKIRVFGRKKQDGGDVTPRQDGGPSPHGDGVEKPLGTFDGDIENKGEVDRSKVRLLRPYTIAVAAIVSIGGFIFGYGKLPDTNRGKVNAN